jgi:hypothetical protein
VLAESGNDEYRWSVACSDTGCVATGYERLKHNAHWLSDTVAGSALESRARVLCSIATGRRLLPHLAIVPVSGGAVDLLYDHELRPHGCGPRLQADENQGKLAVAAVCSTQAAQAPGSEFSARIATILRLIAGLTTTPQHCVPAA